MDSLKNYIQFIKEAEQLKNVRRTAWTSEGKQESTAEHSWRLALLAMAVLEEYPQLNSLKVIKMALLHDIGEIREGDISAALRPDPEQKYLTEERGASGLFSLLPPPLEKEYMELWREYNEAVSKESRLVKALDKAETIMQHNQGCNPPDFDYEFNLEYGQEYFCDDPLFAELRQILDADTRIKKEGQKEAQQKKNG
ncbi:HD domain-containing protein [Eisenbergiella sp.]